MKMAAAAVTLALLLGGCKEQPPVFDSKSVMVRWVDSAGIEARQTEEYSQAYALFEKELGEQPMESVRCVTYLFRLTLPYSQSYRFRLEQQQDSTFILISKAFGTALSGVINPPPSRIIRLHSTSGIITQSHLAETKQAFSRAEFDTFKNTLEGAYYWAWTSPADDRGILDGASWHLESYDVNRYSGGRMALHEVSLTSPEYGSFTRACLYLVQKSVLTNRLPYLNGYSRNFLKNGGNAFGTAGRAIVR